jgi:hypothetical protein
MVHRSVDVGGSHLLSAGCLAKIWTKVIVKKFDSAIVWRTRIHETGRFSDNEVSRSILAVAAPGATFTRLLVKSLNQRKGFCLTLKNMVKTIKGVIFVCR